MITPIDERRQAVRLSLDIPTLVEVVGQREIQLHPNLAKVYERVESPKDAVGKKLAMTLKDLSTNGAFLAGETIPLLSRVAFLFPIEGLGQVEALGWVLWRRSAECSIYDFEGKTTVLPRGFGVLFEALPIEARLEISRQVSAGKSP
jgi:hypothetical protein